MSELTNEQIKAIEGKGGKRWIKGEMDRLYINATYLGLKVEYYKSGNVSASWFDGEDISHAEAYRVMNSKAWIDVKTGELHTSFGRIDPSIRETMVDRAQAILNEATAEPETETA